MTDHTHYIQYMALVLQSLSGGFIWTKLNSFKSTADVKFIKYDEEVAAHTVRSSFYYGSLFCSTGECLRQMFPRHDPVSAAKLKLSALVKSERCKLNY